MEEKEERCPKCESQFIQYNKIMKQCYCLEKSCSHRWDYEIKDPKKIVNAYLRLSCG